MYNVKFTPHRKILGTICDRQTRGHEMVSLGGKYRFFIGDEIQEPDFWFVHGKGLSESETVRVAPANTVLMTTEPESVLIYPKRYTSQFGHVCTSQECIRHPHVILGPTILPWYVGYNESDEDSQLVATLDYDILKSREPHEKKKLISVITSNKSFTQGHIDRISFVTKLKAHFGDSLDIFGRGFNAFDDKWSVLHDYRYHIVIENCSQPYYWSEKLGDCFLAETYPFYYGCTNLNDYFPDGSYTAIDIRNPEQAIRIIEESIAQNTFEKSAGVLRECRELCLDRYNMFESMAAICDMLDPSLPKEDVTINPCVSGQSLRNFWRYTVGRSYYNMKNRIVNGRGVL